MDVDMKNKDDMDDKRDRERDRDRDYDRDRRDRDGDRDRDRDRDRRSSRRNGRDDHWEPDRRNGSDRDVRIASLPVMLWLMSLSHSAVDVAAALHVQGSVRVLLVVNLAAPGPALVLAPTLVLARVVGTGRPIRFLDPSEAP